MADDQSYVPLIEDDDLETGSSLNINSSDYALNDLSSDLLSKETKPASNFGWFVKCGIVFVIFCACIGIYFAPIMTEHVYARHCLALVIFIVSMWATELFPIWATSLMIPILVVWLKVYPDHSTTTPISPPPQNASVDWIYNSMDASDSIYQSAGSVVQFLTTAATKPSQDAAQIVFSKFFSSAVMLALGAFTMSAALTKYELSDRLAWVVLSRVGRKPWVITIVVMFLGVFLSMWVSNVAAPVVVLSLVRPLLHGIPSHDTFNKVLLLAIAYSNNIGGMTTPIASPQNIVAIQNMAAKGFNVGWGPWLAVALPYASLCNLAAFGFLWVFYRPKLVEVPQLKPRDLKPFGWRHGVVLFVCFSTILLWALSGITMPFTGDNGITALIPVVIFCGLKIMSKEDFKALSWDVLVLLGGGLVLGSAIDKSGLLNLIALTIQKIVNGQHPWVIMAAFSSLTWFFGNFMSHTVAAIIITPVVIQVACSVPGGCVAGHMIMLTITSVLVDSGAMALPMTSFPNAAAYNETDKHGKQYLTSNDYIKTGFIIGVLELLLVFSVGYGILYLLKY